uniref:Uncharacterized protein n=1 Tax=Octopus bimaculoides TaxID=37653 RepID=A0A0L8FJE6_OCTBM
MACSICTSILSTLWYLVMAMSLKSLPTFIFPQFSQHYCCCFICKDYERSKARTDVHQINRL